MFLNEAIIKKSPFLEGDYLAERVGFEPTIPFGIRALQARALDQTMRPLRIILAGEIIP